MFYYLAIFLSCKLINQLNCRNKNFMFFPVFYFTENYTNIPKETSRKACKFHLNFIKSKLISNKPL